MAGEKQAQLTEAEAKEQLGIEVSDSAGADKVADVGKVEEVEY